MKDRYSMTSTNCTLPETRGEEGGAKEREGGEKERRKDRRGREERKRNRDPERDFIRDKNIV